MEYEFARMREGDHIFGRQAPQNCETTRVSVLASDAKRRWLVALATVVLDSQAAMALGMSTVMGIAGAAEP